MRRHRRLRQRQMPQSLLASHQPEHFPLRVQVDAMPTPEKIRRLLAKLRQSAVGWVTVMHGIAHRTLQPVDYEAGRRLVRVAHPEVYYIMTRGQRRAPLAINIDKQVWRQARQPLRQGESHFSSRFASATSLLMLANCDKPRLERELPA